MITGIVRAPAGGVRGVVPSGGAASRTIPHDFALIPQLAEAWRSVCRRPECRRAFGCAFGRRRRDGEILDPHSVPC